MFVVPLHRGIAATFAVTLAASTTTGPTAHESQAAAFLDAAPTASALPAVRFAQAGSAGGTIGKKGKSVSGEEQAPARPVQKKSAPARPSEAARPAAASLNGRWLVSQNCSHGKFEIQLDIKQGSATQFSGSSLGITTGARSQIIDGRIEGNNVTFARRAAGLSDQWSARITGAGRMTGTSRGPAWRCTYTATRQ